MEAQVSQILEPYDQLEKGSWKGVALADTLTRAQGAVTPQPQWMGAHYNKPQPSTGNASKKGGWADICAWIDAHSDGRDGDADGTDDDNSVE